MAAGTAHSAIGLGATAWFASQEVRTIMPPHTDFGRFDYVNIGLGVIFGWVTIGSRLGRGIVPGINAGMTGMAAMVFWAIFLQAANEMLKRALQTRYGGPFEAFREMFEIGVEYALNLGHLPLIGILLVGAAVTGLISELVSRKWS